MAGNWERQRPAGKRSHKANQVLFTAFAPLPPRSRSSTALTPANSNQKPRAFQHRPAAEHKQLAENRKQELHKWAVMFAEAKFTNQRILNLNAEMAPPPSVRDSEEYFQRLQELKKAA